MAFQWLIDWLTGQMVLVDVASSAVTPPVGGTALFIDSTGIDFIDGTNMDWIT